MQITRQADYAVRAILYLARAGKDERVATIGEAARLMVEHKIGGLPVVEDGELVGIITETDFCRLLMLQPEAAA